MMLLRAALTNIPLHRDVILQDEVFVEEAQNIHYLENHLLKSSDK